MKKRYMFLIILLMLSISYILADNFCIGGYDCQLLSDRSGNLIQDYQGYQKEKEKFLYQKESTAYIKIAAWGSKHSPSQLILEFKDSPDQDISIKIKYKDKQDYLLDNVTKGIWKKGKNYSRIDVTPGIYGSYLLEIPADCELSRVYYAWETQKTGIGKETIFLIIFLIELLLGMAAYVIVPVRNKIGFLAGRLVQWGNKLNCGPEKYVTGAGYFLVIVAGSVFFAWILAETGICTFSWKLAFLLTMIELLLLLVYLRCRGVLHIKSPALGFWSVLLLGTTITVMQPGFTGVSWDDNTHYGNVIAVSRILEDKTLAADKAMQEDYYLSAWKLRGYSRQDQKERYELYNVLTKGHYYCQKENIAIASSFTAYLPSVIGIVLGRGLGLPYQAMVILGRWMNVLFFAGMTYWSMKKLKRGGLVVLMFAMIPTNIYICANYTYDIWLTGWSMLALCAFLGEWERPHDKISDHNVWLIPLAMYLALLPKMIYFPLGMILLFLPESKFMDKKHKWIYRGLVIFVIFAPLLRLAVPILFTNGESLGRGDLRGGNDVNAALQLQGMLADPRKTVRIFAAFLKDYLNPYYQGIWYLSYMGFLGKTLIKHTTILFVLMVGALLCQNKEAKYPWWTRVGALCVYAVIGFGAALAMYIEFTPLGSETINGCLGRYLLPTIFPLLYIMTRWRKIGCLDRLPVFKHLMKEDNIVAAIILFFSYAAVLQLWRGCLMLY